jgi:hypothetical protein
MIYRIEMNAYKFLEMVVRENNEDREKRRLLIATANVIDSNTDKARNLLIEGCLSETVQECERRYHNTVMMKNISNNYTRYDNYKLTEEEITFCKNFAIRTMDARIDYLLTHERNHPIGHLIEERKQVEKQFRCRYKNRNEFFIMLIEKRSLFSPQLSKF